MSEDDSAPTSADPPAPDPIVFDDQLISAEQRSEDLGDVIRFDSALESKIELSNPFGRDDYRADEE